MGMKTMLLLFVAVGAMVGFSGCYCYNDYYGHGYGGYAPRHSYHHSSHHGDYGHGGGGYGYGGGGYRSGGYGCRY